MEARQAIHGLQPHNNRGLTSSTNSNILTLEHCFATEDVYIPCLRIENGSASLLPYITDSIAASTREERIETSRANSHQPKRFSRLGWDAACNPIIGRQAARAGKACRQGRSHLAHRALQS